MINVHFYLLFLLYNSITVLGRPSLACLNNVTGDIQQASELAFFFFKFIYKHYPGVQNLSSKKSSA